ncbi:MAG: DUF5372 family protein [Planctomycetota bacterium]
MTHPYHPLFGREFELVVRRQNWGEDRVLFHNAEGRLVSLPARWTSVFVPDPYVVVSAGRSPFRVDDLLRLAKLIQEWDQDHAVA